MSAKLRRKIFSIEGGRDPNRRVSGSSAGILSVWNEFKPDVGGHDEETSDKGLTEVFLKLEARLVCFYTHLQLREEKTH